MLREVGERLAERQITIDLTERAEEELVREGDDRGYGARPLRRTVERRVENALSKRIIAGEFKEGDHVVIDYNAAGYTFTKGSPAPAEPEREPVGTRAQQL